MSMVLDAGDATTTPIGSSSSSDGNNQSVAAMNKIAYTSNVTINGGQILPWSVVTHCIHLSISSLDFKVDTMCYNRPW